MRGMFSVGGVILLSLCFSAKGLACDCVTPSAEESFQRADAVFVGEMIYSREFENTTGSFPSTFTTYTFRVAKSLKGNKAEEVSVTNRGFDCDSRFGLGSFYLVYAKSFEGKLTSGICDGNMALGVSPDTLRGSQPGNVSSSTFRYREIIAILGAAVLLCLVIWFIPGKTRRRAA